ncbi:MAG: DMT family transporter [Firmicutes bacterium]|jgi:drug/metabolite transporter (DMT)-like permease|uniref:EamA/RhaT family transporter n=1 Tax=Sulfobacillus benefaciens TaxID=453960 RepID=A0A2T2WYI1_9FIRM|nr:DMT family transporter [Bacillota bacterium]MCL5015750.1 DMT family transporter [Bacillota bacterium]PSR27299.1 MAG: EamA/RhaT family transporter [Sulfobacillus benefaciens]
MNARGFYFGMFLVVLSWGLNYVITKIGVGHFAPADFVFWRFLATAILCLPWMVRTRPNTLLQYGKVAILGLIGVSFYQWAFTQALHQTLAANVAFLFDVSPLMTLAGQRLLRLRASTPGMFVGAGVSLAGVSLLMGASRGGSLQGDAMALLAAFAWSVFTILTDKFRVPVKGIALTGWMSLFGTVGIMPLMTWHGIVPHSFSVSLPLTYTVLFVTIMGLSLWQNAVLSVGGGKASLYLYLIPVIAAAAGWVILGESLNILEGAGALLIIFGVSVAEGVFRLRTPPSSPRATYTD